MAESETVLVVDDEPLVRTLVRRVLRDRGFAVLETSSGTEALDAAQKTEHDIDLLVTDIRMPGMNGWELASRFHAVRPDARILYMSGYSDEISGAPGLQTGVDFIEKPFSQAGLLAKVMPLVKALPHRKQPASASLPESAAPPVRLSAPASAPVASSAVARSAWKPVSLQMGRAAELLMQLEWQARRGRS